MTSSSSLDGSNTNSPFDSRNVGMSGGPVVKEEITNFPPMYSRTVTDYKSLSSYLDNSLLSGMSNNDNNPMTMTPAQRLALRRSQRNQRNSIGDSNIGGVDHPNNHDQLIENNPSLQPQQPQQQQQQQQPQQQAPNNQMPLAPRQFRLRSSSLLSSPSSQGIAGFATNFVSHGHDNGYSENNNGYLSSTSQSSDMSSSGSESSETSDNKKPSRHIVHVFCAGDDDQSIYAWRGAKVELMRRFQYDFPNGRVVKFGISYRLPVSTLNIAPSLPLSFLFPFSFLCRSLILHLIITHLIQSNNYDHT